MGAVGGMLGLGGGGGGTGISTLSPANIQTPVSTTQAQNSIQDTQNLISALQRQNGLQNQTDVYNQLQGVANGTGPNPAKAQLAQATGANTANQAALMAGQRGANQNVGLIARQAAMQGAQNQQQAAGQAATLQAQQSLNAMQQSGNMANTMAGNQIGAQQTQEQALLNAIASQNQSQVGVNAANANMAGTRMGQQPGAIGGLLGGVGSALPMVGGLFGGGGGGGDALGLAGDGELAGGAGDAGGLAGDAMMVAAEGGEVDPSTMPTINDMQPQSSPSGPQSSFGKMLAQKELEQGQAQNQSILSQPQATPKPASVGSGGTGGSGGSGGGGLKFDWGGAGTGALKGGAMGAEAGSFFPGIGTVIGAGIGAVGGALLGGVKQAAEGGRVPAMVSPGEQYLPPNEVKEVAAGKKSPLSAGERIPGTPKVKGAKNSYENDTVPKTLEEGGIVIPRSITQGPNPHWAAMKFVHATMAKSRHKAKK